MCVPVCKIIYTKAQLKQRLSLFKSQSYSALTKMPEDKGIITSAQHKAEHTWKTNCNKREIWRQGRANKTKHLIVFLHSTRHVKRLNERREYIRVCFRVKIVSPFCFVPHHFTRNWVTNNVPQSQFCKKKSIRFFVVDHNLGNVVLNS